MRSPFDEVFGLRSPFGSRRFSFTGYTTSGFEPVIVADFTEREYGVDAFGSTWGMYRANNIYPEIVSDFQYDTYGSG